MQGSRRLGKFDEKYLRKVIFRRLGVKRREILVGPRFGVDNSVVRLANGNVLVATTDPLSFIPELGARDSAWLSVNLLASDLATSGFASQYGMFDFNLPPRLKESQFAEYWRAFHTECARIGLAIVGGHTGKYEGCDYTVIGGGVLFAIGPERDYLTSAMARDGDDVVLTKGTSIETTAILSRVFPRIIRRALGTRLLERSRRYLRKVTTVDDALTAVSVGVHRNGVTAMHDATEGGVTAAVMELAMASGLGMELDLDKVLISEETEKICQLFRIDPLTSLSEGSLVIACRPHKTKRLLTKLHSIGTEAEQIGNLTSRTRSVYGTGRRGRVRLRYPTSDPYWKAYRKATRKGWN